MNRSRTEDIAQAFSGALEYDRHARVQHDVARGLARRIAGLPLPSASRILEIGCGTGFLAEALLQAGLTGDWTITDLSPAMIERARMRLGQSLRYAILDGERGTPDGGPYDLICTNMATQWFADEPRALDRWRQWLAPGGHIMVATLGPGTFAEWRAAHRAEGLEPGTPTFTPVAALDALGPAEPVIVERYSQRYADARAFLSGLRAIGADTARPDHRPLSPAMMRRVMRRFEAQGAVASYEVMTCHLTRATGSA